MLELFHDLVCAYEIIRNVENIGEIQINISRLSQDDRRRILERIVNKLGRKAFRVLLEISKLTPFPL